jgi:hypothetical protein
LDPERRNVCKFFVERNLLERHHLEDREREGRIALSIQIQSEHAAASVPEACSFVF